ncbi:hypothetical protein TSAR_003373, partial [Trichomalopsis sarcophagae]
MFNINWHLVIKRHRCVISNENLVIRCVVLGGVIVIIRPAPAGACIVALWRYQRILVVMSEITRVCLLGIARQLYTYGIAFSAMMCFREKEARMESREASTTYTPEALEAVRREEERRLVREGTEIWRARKEESLRQKQREQCELRRMLANYWPWGRPGGGAPCASALRKR